MAIMEISETFEYRMKTVMSALPLAGPAETAAVAAALHRSGPRAIKLEWIVAQIEDLSQQRADLRKRYEGLRADFENEIAELMKAVD